MELLEGETLGARLERGALPLQEVVALTIEIADALDAAHAHQIIHRDIKPANIFITSRGRAKLMDFGVATRQRGDAGLSTTGLAATAALTELGQAIGTVAYMSPEQARGERLDARTDLFSLGVVMYESAAGTRPFHGGTDAVVFDALLNRDPVPLRTLRQEVPEALDDIVSGLLQKDREARTPSAADLLRRLRSLGESTRPPAFDEQSPARHSRRARALTAAAALCLAIAAGGVAWWARPTPPPREIQSVALLPFENRLGADASDVVDGLLAAVNGDLAKSQAIQVLAPGAVEQYRATTRTVAEIGRELHADALLSVVATGSGGRIQLNASLSETRNGRTFWSASFDRPRGQLDQLQADLADGVGHALGLTPAAAVGPRRTTTPAVDPRAYDLYLRARYHASRWNEKDIDRAIELLEQATTLDATFGAAQGLLGYAYGVKSANFRPTDTVLMEKGFAAVARSLEENEAGADAHMARGLLLWQPSQGFAQREALGEFQRALSERPSFDEAWNQRGIVLFHIGHLDEALKSIERAIALNPGNANARFRIAPIRVYQQQYEEAVAVLRRVPREAYTTQWTYQLAWSLIALGRLDEASKEIEDSLAASANDQGGVVHAARAMLRVKRGDRRGALADVDEAIARGRGFIHFHHTAYSIGAVYAQLGDFTRAQHWIEQAAADGFPCYTLFENDPLLAGLREMAEFRTFLVKLRQQWQHLPEIEARVGGA